MKSSQTIAATGPHPDPQSSLWTIGLRNRLVSNLAWSTVSELLGRGLVLFGSLLIARALDVEVFGLLIAAQALASCFWIAVDFGIGMYGVREVARHHDDPSELMGQLFSLRLLICLVCAPLFLLVAWLKCESLESLGIHLACGLSLLGVALQPNWALRGLEQFRLIAWGNFVSATAFLVGAAYWIRTPQAGVAAGLLWSSWFLLSAAVLLFAMARQGQPLRFCWQPSSWGRHLRASWLFATSGALVLVYCYAPVLLLECLSSNYQLGLFGPPFRILVAVGALGFLIPNSFYPVLAKSFIADRDQFRAARRGLQLASLAAGLIVGGLLFVASGPLVEGVLGAAYLSSAPVLAILAWMAPLQFLRNAYRVELMAAERQRCVNLALLAGVVASVLAACWWIPLFGAQGAASSLLLGEACMVVVMAALASRALGVDHSPPKLSSEAMLYSLSRPHSRT